MTATANGPLSDVSTVSAQLWIHESSSLESIQANSRAEATKHPSSQIFPHQNMNKNERARLETSLVVLCGLWHTFDQWTRVLLPFSQWALKPRPDMNTLLLLNSIASVFMFVGTFLVAQMIEAHGIRRTALFITAIISVYQVLVSRMQHVWAYGALQGLLLVNHIPMIIDATVVYIDGEHGDIKRRTLLLNRLTVPVSIGLAAGPWIALQLLFTITSDLHTSQWLCGAFNFIVVIPLCAMTLPNKTEGSTKLKMPSMENYKSLLKNPNTRWCIVLLMMVIGPYCAYDQVIRMSVAATVISQPTQMTYLFLLMGITSLLINLLILPRLQSRFGPFQILTGSFTILTCSYIYLSQVTDYQKLLYGLPVQITGVSIALGELQSQIIGTVGTKDSGKVAALLRMAQLLAMMMTPLVTGHYVDRDETSILCYVSAVVSLSAIPTLLKFGKFMTTHETLSLPLSGKID